MDSGAVEAWLRSFFRAVSCRVYVGLRITVFSAIRVIDGNDSTAMPLRREVSKTEVCLCVVCVVWCGAEKI